MQKVWKDGIGCENFKGNYIAIAKLPTIFYVRIPDLNKPDLILT
jgi:hypothetical protein